MRALRAGIVGAWLAGNLAWLRADRLVRDGDEEGHVGAAELFRGQLMAGDWFSALRDALMGDLGEYPPLVPALTGAWWWLTGIGQPGAWPVRAGLLAAPLVAALATASVARRMAGRGNPEVAATGALVAALLLPLGVGLGRHFMPESVLVAAVAVAVAVAAWAAERPSPSRALCLGLVLGAGLLVKQTFVLVAALPVLAAGWRLGWRWCLVGLAAAATAGPWVARNGTEQLAYGAASLSGGGAAVAHALYYPWALATLVLGPAVALCVVAAVANSWAERDRRPLVVGLVWLVGGAALLTLVPKKYPRLAAPLGPAAALLCGVALGRTERWRPWLASGSAAATGWLVATSTVGVPFPDPPAGGVDAKCAQVWLRPPSPDDLGLSAIASRLSALPDGPVSVVGGPSVPCSVQTTHDWAHHLAPYLRREGHERAVVETGPVAATVEWVEGSPPAGAVAVPALGGAFVVRAGGLAPGAVDR